MALEVRRIVTGHDSQGKTVVATDERLAGTGAAGRAGISRVDVWSTDKMPIDNSDAAAELQRKGFVVRHNYVGSGQGSVCRVVEFAPGGAKFVHRTETLDYAICLKGECDLELDDGRTVELTVVPIVKPEAANFIFGQSHFIKTVEDLHEALVGAVPGIRFGLAFCEASG